MLESSHSVGASVAGGALSATAHQRLSEVISGGLNKISGSNIDLQKEEESLPGVTLQNHGGLNLLTAEKGGNCIFLRK